jgi:predicted transcriptional regulator
MQLSFIKLTLYQYFSKTLMEKYKNNSNYTLTMTKGYEEKILNELKETEPQTPNEISKKIGINEKTVQTILLELLSTNDKVKMKKIGRYRLFWLAK